MGGIKSGGAQRELKGQRIAVFARSLAAGGLRERHRQRRGCGNGLAARPAEHFAARVYGLVVLFYLIADGVAAARQLEAEIIGRAFQLYAQGLAGFQRGTRPDGNLHGGGCIALGNGDAGGNDDRVARPRLRHGVGHRGRTCSAVGGDFGVRQRHARAQQA